MLILHGLFGMLDNWATLAKRFAEYYQVYLIDLRNHGKSPHSEEMNYQVMADDIAEFCNDHKLNDSILIGHSMGGKVAMQFSVDHQELLYRLIIADIAPKAYTHGHSEVFEALYGVDLSTVSRRSEADKALEPFLPDFGMRQFILKNLDRKEGGGYGWKPAVDIIRDNYDRIVEEIVFEDQLELPTLFIRGGDSSYVQESDWIDIQDAYSDVKLETIDGAGHWVHAVNPEAFYDLVIEFIS